MSQSFPLINQFIPNLIKVTLVRSTIRTKPLVKESLRCLGLRKINHHRYHKNTSEIRGMLFRAKSHVTVEEVPLYETPQQATEAQKSIASLKDKINQPKPQPPPAPKKTYTKPQQLPTSATKSTPPKKQEPVSTTQ